MQYYPSSTPPIKPDPSALLRVLRTSPTGRHFFCAGGADGSITRLVRLAHELRDDVCFVGMRPSGLVAGEPLHATIADNAAAWRREVRRLQPRGPYLLGGYCFGGVVAHELAVQLVNEGEHVELMLIDANYPTARLGGTLSRTRLLVNAVPATWKWLASRMRSGELGSLKTYADRLLLLLRRRGYSEDVPAGLSSEQQQIWAGRARAFRNYRPRHLRGRATVLRADGHSWFSMVDPTLGWHGLIDELEVIDAPGGHASMLQPPHVQRLATLLRTRLAGP